MSNQERLLSEILGVLQKIGGALGDIQQGTNCWRCLHPFGQHKGAKPRQGRGFCDDCLMCSDPLNVGGEQQS